MNKNNEEIQLLDIQIWATAGFILVSLISIILTYNQKQNVKNEKPLFSDKQKKDLIIFNRFFSLLLVIIFLLINFKTYKDAKEKHEREAIEIEQLIAGAITLIAALLTLDATFKDLKSEKENPPIASIENPTL